MSTQRAAARRALVRNAVVLLAAVLAIVVAAERRFEDNPRRVPAEAMTDRMDGVFDDVRAGRVDLPATPGPVDAPDGPDVDDGAILGVRTARGRSALVGRVGTTCYGVWWGEDGRRRTRIVADGRPCDPVVATSDDPLDIGRSGLAADVADGPARWEALLPENTSVKPWWIPLVIAAGWLALSASTRIIVIVVTRGRNLAKWSRAA